MPTAERIPTAAALAARRYWAGSVRSGYQSTFTVDQTCPGRPTSGEKTRPRLSLMKGSRPSRPAQVTDGTSCCPAGPTRHSTPAWKSRASAIAPSTRSPASAIPSDPATTAATASSRPTTRRAASSPTPPTLMRKSYSGIRERPRRGAVDHLQPVRERHHIERGDHEARRPRGGHQAADEPAGDPDAQTVRAGEQLADGAAQRPAARSLVDLASAGALLEFRERCPREGGHLVLREDARELVGRH